MSEEEQEELIRYLVECLNDPRFCEEHILVRDCPKKDIQCGDCLLRYFYEERERERE